MSDEWFMMVMSRKNPEQSPTVRKILDGLVEYANGHLITSGDTSECFKGMYRGEMVAFATCHENEVSSAAQWDLVPGDKLVMIHQVPAMHVLNPKRYESLFS
ncbi:hypothetical protein MTO96_027876 [Rhipicephalus appendiculatus]